MRQVIIVALLCLVAGCTAPPPPPQGTGAREAAVDFWQAVLRQDWDRAYGQLSAPTRQRLSPPQFIDRAKDYHRQLRFEQKEVKVSACDESGTQALAHVVLIGETRRYKGGLSLHRDEAGWKVDLPANFGQRNR
jgi:hypothetical protein